MDRVQIAAIALAAGLLIVWYLHLPKAPPPGPESSSLPAQPVEEGEQSPAFPNAGTEPAFDPMTQPMTQPDELAPPPARKPEPAEHQRSWLIENDALRVRVGSLGGRLESVQLPGFTDRIGDDAEPVELVTARRGALLVALGDGPLAGFESATYEEVSSDRDRLVLRARREGIVVERTLELDREGYGGRLRVSLTNDGAEPLQPSFRVYWYGEERASDAPNAFYHYSLIASAGDSIARVPLRGIDEPGLIRNLTGRGPWEGDRLEPPVEWVGLVSQYFLAASIPENPGEAEAFQRPAGRDAGLVVVGYPRFEVPPGRFVERTYRLYLGPKLAEPMAVVDERLGDSVEAGWAFVRPLVLLFAWLLHWTYDNVVGNYGVAIILLTIVLRVLIFPLSQRQFQSMKKLQTIAPEMKELQERFKDDREKLQAEMMALYRKKGMNPVTAMGGGCVPLLIQMPFLIALYFSLQISMELRHAPFVAWINDLSAPETLFSVAGLPIRVLPLLMGGTMVLQQRLMPAQGVDPQQRQMMMWMSVAFIFLFYSFPSGLVLYWFVSNLLGIAQQAYIQYGRKES